MKIVYEYENGKEIYSESHYCLLLMVISQSINQ